MTVTVAAWRTHSAQASAAHVHSATANTRRVSCLGSRTAAASAFASSSSWMSRSGDVCTSPPCAVPLLGDDHQGESAHSEGLR